MKIRLDRYLAGQGAGTRSQVKKDIASGLVRVNGVPVKRPEEKIDPERDPVTYRDHPVIYEKYVYYMMNKPAGVVTATEDRNLKTVMDLMDENRKESCFPVGRLDRDTEGLLLITDDGETSHRLLSPRRHVDKTYYAEVQGVVTEADVHAFSLGVDIGDEKPTLPGELEILSSGAVSRILLTIREGRFHQVKRMFHAVGKEVIYLKRTGMGGLTLDESLLPGQYRKLTEEEVNQICSAGRKQ